MSITSWKCRTDLALLTIGEGTCLVALDETYEEIIDDESMDETIGPDREAAEDVSPTGKSIFDDSDEGSTDSEMLFDSE